MLATDGFTVEANASWTGAIGVGTTAGVQSRMGAIREMGRLIAERDALRRVLHEMNETDGEPTANRSTDGEPWGPSGYNSSEEFEGRTTMSPQQIEDRIKKIDAKLKQDMDDWVAGGDLNEDALIEDLIEGRVTEPGWVWDHGARKKRAPAAQSGGSKSGGRASDTGSSRRSLSLGPSLVSDENRQCVSPPSESNGTLTLNGTLVRVRKENGQAWTGMDADNDNQTVLRVPVAWMSWLTLSLHRAYEVGGMFGAFLVPIVAARFGRFPPIPSLLPPTIT